MAKLIGVVVELAVGCSVLLACSSPVSSDAIPAVAPEDLQADIAARLATAGEKPQSVVCKDPLIGEVGQSARCDVTMGPTNSFEPVVTVTDIDGAAIVYEMIPALSRPQLERAVARLVSSPPEAVACLAGLPGRTGAEAQCDVTSGGPPLRRTATVTISAPDASMARAVSAKSLYLPVPTIRRERKVLPATVQLSSATARG